jgi:hypothetical protein
MTTESSTKQTGQAHDRDRELVRALTDALILAAGKRTAHRALRNARTNSRSTLPHRAVRAAAHLAGYSALLGYIWRQRRSAHQSAA